MHSADFADRRTTPFSRMAMVTLAVLVLALAGVACIVFDGSEASDGVKIVNGVNYEVNEDEGCAYVVYSDDETLSDNVVIQPYIKIAGEEYEVVSIEPYAFSDTSIKSVSIPNTIQKIHYDAFAGCENLKTVKFAADSVVDVIGGYAFGDCISLESITLPASVEEIDNSCFEGCEALKTVKFEADSNFKSIGSEAFLGCTSLSSITLPDSLEWISDYAFSHTSLSSIKIPENVFYISTCAFSKCTTLKYFTVDPGNEYYTTDGQYKKAANSGYAIIYNGYELVCLAGGYTGEYTIPSYVTSIDSYAFRYIPGLTAVTFPAGVDYISNYDGNIFYGSDSLAKITVAKGNPQFATDKAINATTGYALINLDDWDEETVLFSFAPAFSGDYTIPVVDTVDWEAFYGCALRSVVIPDGIVLDGCAFDECPNLQRIEFGNDIEFWGDPFWMMRFYAEDRETELSQDAGLCGCVFNGSDGVFFREAGIVHVASIRLSDLYFTLDHQEEYRITAYVSPEDAEDRSVTWSSSDVNVAKVDRFGTVIGVGDGTATITATTNDGGKTAECVVEVWKHVTDITLDKSLLQLPHVGDTAVLTATIMPADATYKSVEWWSSNENVATVDQFGKVTAVGAGTADIWAEASDGWHSVCCEVQVEIPVTGVSLDVTEKMIGVGESFNLTATVVPENATNKNVGWWSNDIGVATVDQNGKVTGVSSGNATVWVETEDGRKSVCCDVTVYIPVESVSLNKDVLDLETQDYYSLKATILPADATYQDISWSSSNPDVVSVDPYGKVVALKKGTAEITVTTEDGGKTAVCDVTVKTFVDSIKMDSSDRKVDISAGAFTVQAEVMPADADNKALTWESSDKTVASVDKNGKVTPLKVGKTTITVTSVDNPAVYRFFEVEVIKMVASITMDKTATMGIGETMVLKAIVSPSDATCTDLKWTSDNEWAVKVDQNGKLTSMGRGTARITATTTDGSDLSAVCTVTVKGDGGILGDVDDDGFVGPMDPVYLLYHIFFGNEMYPVSQGLDYDGDGAVTPADAVYLLYNVFFGDERYPLHDSNLM